MTRPKRPRDPNQLARRARMTRQGLLKIERGANVTLGTIALLADALGCQIADFFPRKSPWISELR